MRRTTTGRLVALAVAASVTGLTGLAGLAGCSHSSPPPDIDSAQASSGPSAPTTPGTATPSIATTSGPGVPGDVLAARVRSAMARAGSARFALQSAKTSGPDATGVLAFRGSSVSVRFDFTDGTDKLRVISVPGVLYADVGEVVDGRHWLRVTANGSDALSSAMAPLLSYMTNSADVSSQASSWGAAGTFSQSASAAAVGDSGVIATVYDGTIPRAAVQAGLPAQFREVMRKDITGDSHVRLWLDGSDRPVKVVTSGSYDGKPDLVTVTYTDWGRAPGVVAPPAADVISSRG